MRANKRLKTSPSAPDHRQDFELAIICALPLEANAVIATFDHHWVEEDKKYGKATGDPNAYTTGVIGSHNVVVAHMPGMGKVSAAGVAVGLRMSFPGIKLAVVVGICGGVPSGPHEREIYLGDVVISQCLVQYDFGRQYPEGFEPKGTIQGGSGVPTVAIQAVLCKLETDYHSAKLWQDTGLFLRELKGNSVRAQYPGAECDQLFKPSYLHQHRNPKDCSECGKDGSHACAEALATTCEKLGCGSDDGLAPRQKPLGNERPSGPSIHIGKMGSGDTVMKSGTHRDEIARRDGIIAFEMEGAGIYAHFPSLVIKGVCDYADSHKNKQWQDYAAATAAACTKAFLQRWISRDDFHASEARPAMKPIFMVNLMRENVLIGRENVMEFLTEKLSSEGHNRAALVALGGTGYKLSSASQRWMLTLH
jgi:nucleoside phosphorylase